MRNVKAAIANPEPTTAINEMLEENTCFSIDKNSITIVVTYTDKIKKYNKVYKKVKKYINGAGWSSGCVIEYDGIDYTIYLNLLPNKVK